jgi:hypothetical protein
MSFRSFGQALVQLANDKVTPPSVAGREARGDRQSGGGNAGPKARPGVWPTF